MRPASCSLHWLEHGGCFVNPWGWMLGFAGQALCPQFSEPRRPALDAGLSLTWGTTGRKAIGSLGMEHGHMAWEWRSLSSWPLRSCREGGGRHSQPFVLPVALMVWAQGLTHRQVQGDL